MKTVLLGGALLLISLFSATNVFAQKSAPSAPLMISGFASAVKGTEVTFSVHQYPGVLGYYWNYPAGWRVLRGQGTTNITFLTTDASESGMVTVEEIRKEDKRTSSMAVKLVGAKATQVNRPEVPFDARVFPGVSNSHFNVRTQSGNLDEPIQLVVYDLMGRTVEMNNRVAAGSTLRVGDAFQAGVYIIEVKQGEARKQTKVIKQ